MPKIQISAVTLVVRPVDIESVHSPYRSVARCSLSLSPSLCSALSLTIRRQRCRVKNQCTNISKRSIRRLEEIGSTAQVFLINFIYMIMIMDINNYCNYSKTLEDPRSKSTRYSKNSRVKFDKDQFEFEYTQFLIDNNYIGEPPHVQVSIENLNDNIDENFLKKDLAKLGHIRTLEIIRHPRTGQHLGMAKVQFEDVSVARACVKNFHGKQIMGRQLKVFLDIRFAIIEKLKAEILNPRPQPLPTNRQRLEDRIATLMRQPNCVLSTMAGPQATQAFFSSQPYLQPSAIDQNNKLENCSDNQSEDDWKSESPEPLNIELSEEQIESEVLPYCFEEFFKELTKNLESTIFKKLRESYGYQCIEKAQAANKRKLDQIQLQRDQERKQRELQKQFETRFIMSKNRSSANDRQAEAPRPRANLIRQRTGAYNSLQDSRGRGEADLRRVNRSSAYVSEPGRRGSHSTSIESDFSGRDSSSSRSSRSSSRSSRSSSSASSSSSRSSSPFGPCRTESCSSYSSSRSGSMTPRSEQSDRMSPVRKNRKKATIEAETDFESQKVTRGGSNVIDYTIPDEKGKLDERTEDENIALSALMDMGVNKEPNGPNQSEIGAKRTKSNMDDFIVDDDEEFEPKPKKRGPKAGKKRKKASEVMGIASEYRSAKRFASEPRSASRIDVDDDLENAMMVDENLLELKPESRYLFPERSPEEKMRILDDLFGTLTEEDLKYLKEVHTSTLGNVPFGTDNANKAHLLASKRMIETKLAEVHPKWWRGCSRCDVIEVSEKEKMQIDETNYEDLTKAPIKSNVIQAATSSRRDLRGDQRRIAVLNPELDADILKLLTTNTLQVRYLTNFLSIILASKISWNEF